MYLGDWFPGRFSAMRTILGLGMRLGFGGRIDNLLVWAVRERKESMIPTFQLE